MQCLVPSSSVFLWCPNTCRQVSVVCSLTLRCPVLLPGTKSWAEGDHVSGKKTDLLEWHWMIPLVLLNSLIRTNYSKNTHPPTSTHYSTNTHVTTIVYDVCVIILVVSPRGDKARAEQLLWVRDAHGGGRESKQDYIAWSRQRLCYFSKPLIRFSVAQRKAFHSLSLMAYFKLSDRTSGCLDLS